MYGLDEYERALESLTSRGFIAKIGDDGLLRIFPSETESRHSFLLDSYQVKEWAKLYVPTNLLAARWADEQLLAALNLLKVLKIEHETHESGKPLLQLLEQSRLAVGTIIALCGSDSSAPVGSHYRHCQKAVVALKRAGYDARYRYNTQKKMDEVVIAPTSIDFAHSFVTLSDKDRDDWAMRGSHTISGAATSALKHLTEFWHTESRSKDGRVGGATLELYNQRLESRIDDAMVALAAIVRNEDSIQRKPAGKQVATD